MLVSRSGKWEITYCIRAQDGEKVGSVVHLFGLNLFVIGGGVIADCRNGFG